MTKRAVSGAMSVTVTGAWIDCVYVGGNALGVAAGSWLGWVSGGGVWHLPGRALTWRARLGVVGCESWARVW